MTAEATTIPVANDKSTPMMAQYLQVKAAHADMLLFYRMGDFYELFFEDAVTAAEVLDIALTKRGKHNEQEIPMCGVPFHSYEPYMQKLIRSGYKVAICEQMESPEEAKKRGYKAVVRREVVRIVTPGTITEDSLLDARESNYLACISEAGGRMALAWMDVSTGEFFTCPASKELLAAELARLNIRELLISETLHDQPEWQQMLRDYRRITTPHVQSFFDSQRGEKRLKGFYGVASLESFGRYDKAQLSACGALLEYVELTQKGALPRLQPPKQIVSGDFMLIDAATRRNLELAYTLSGEKKGSLLSVIDRTITGPGARLLASSLAAPLTNPQAISKRFDMVQWFIENDRVRAEVRDLLKEMPDMERSLSRICIGRGGPRDLAAIRNGLFHSRHLAEILEYSGAQLPAGIQDYLVQMGNHDALLSKLQRALKEEVTGALARDGNFVADGFHPKLDELRDLRKNAREHIRQMQEEYRKLTGVNTLKISQNNVLGYFVEVTPTNSSKVTDEQFIHRQTLASAVRYTTEALRQLENDILSASEQCQRIEMMVFETLVTDIMQVADAIAAAAAAVSGIDMMAGLGELAVQQRYTRPELTHQFEFEVKGGRHPVVEVALQGEQFIANDCQLEDHQRLWLLTGPNMAGKSTFLRQNALIVLMAQLGSYVPATSAKIGCVDRLFSRVGASDDLARGRSTFMVEMVETATILNQATEKSLVILDEIGRGTATYDGLSIAWATVEHLHNNNRCRALFATHYHELTALAPRLPQLDCFSLQVKEWKGEVVFLHSVAHGAADRSYGVHVAKLAGLPRSVVQRAENVLAALQRSEGQKLTLADDLPLFTAQDALPQELPNPPSLPPHVAELYEKLQSVRVDDLSPREALNVLYQLKELAG